MAGLVVLLVVALVLVGTVVAVIVLTGRRAGAQPTAGSPRDRRVAATTTRWRVVGAVIGLVGGVAVAQSGALGRGLLLAAPLFALTVVVGVVVGELRVPVPDGPVRTASLQVRRVRDHLPRRLGATVLAAAVALTVVATWTTLAGSADDMGRAGRSLAYRCSPTSGGAVGPWPGSYYTLPLAALVLAGTVLTVVALRRIVRRPRDLADQHADEVLRRGSVAAVTAAVGLLVSVPLAGISFIASIALTRVDCQRWWEPALAGALGLVVPGALALVAWCTAVLVLPAGAATVVPAGR